MLNGAHLLLALSGGLITSSWGAFKDTPYEGFSSISFMRSILVTVFYYFVLKQVLIIVDGYAYTLLVVLAAIGIERMTQEIWKGFFRSKHRGNLYKIPQSFHIFGKVQPYMSRVILGSIFVYLLIMLAFFLSTLRLTGNSWITFGIIFATIPSFGGAWKDAPIEGFDIRKFPRSFLVMFLAIALLHSLTTNALILIMAAGGLERVLVEFYKTFIILSTPGKFFEKVHRKTWLKKRRIFVWTYVFAVVITIGAVCVLTI